MFEKILIANRGEIALRIIKACRELGIKTVAVYSQADKDCLHVTEADQAICIGPPQPALSYLNVPNIISAAEISHADAIHPGYGFLAENAQFAEICDTCKIKFVGPTSKDISRMGNKALAKKLMDKSGVPIIPGTKGIIKTDKEATTFCNKAGYPVMIKASAGGGGRGMRIACNEKELKSFVEMAKAEAKTAFGDDSLYIEKYIDKPRHIEVQVLADSKGNAIALGERDCSVQRRHQKLIEESPAMISKKTREGLLDVAVKAVKGIGYVSAGTIEFLVDKDENYYFMECNTRIQVEHPVTEAVTGIDLIKEQIKIAMGEELPIKQENIKIRGHAIEFRINAEDPDDNFKPNAGKIKRLKMPKGAGIRIDTHLYEGYSVPPFYDSLLAKLIVHAENRHKCMEKSKKALLDFKIEGIKTTIPFHLKTLENKEFIKGGVDTGFLERT